MWTVVGSVLTGVLLAYIASRLAKGSRRWRDLTEATHELEAAALLPKGPLRDELETRANLKLQRYIADPGRAGRVNRWEMLQAFMTVGAAFLGLFVVMHFELPEWTLWIAGLGSGFLAVTVLRWFDRQAPAISDESSWLS